MIAGWRPALLAALVGALMGVAVGLASGWRLWGSAAPSAEAPAPAMRQADGSLVVERAPAPRVVPRATVPEGARVDRVVRVRVRPTPGTTAPADSAAGVPRETPTTPVADREPAGMPMAECPEVEVELAIVTLADGTRRAVASAIGGTVLGGVDIPVGPVARPVLRWAAGVQYATADGRVGAFVDRDLARVALLPLPGRVGVSVYPTATGLQAAVRLGVRF